MTLKKCIHNTTLNNEALPCSKSDKVGLKEVAKLMINAPTGKVGFNEAMTQEDCKRPRNILQISHENIWA